MAFGDFQDPPPPAPAARASKPAFAPPPAPVRVPDCVDLTTAADENPALQQQQQQQQQQTAANKAAPAALQSKGANQALAQHAKDRGKTSAHHLYASLHSRAEFKLAVADPLRQRVSDKALMVLRRPEFKARCKKDGTWVAGLVQYGALVNVLKKSGLAIDKIPTGALQSLSRVMTNEAGYGAALDNAADNLRERLPPHIMECLTDFQLEGVWFVARRAGRGMIADEPGLGKTIQAIAVAALYPENWPCLVITPSSTRYHWYDEFVKWLPGLLAPEHIFVMAGPREPIPRNTRVVIISYNLVSRRQEELSSKTFGVVIADESHYLKNSTSKRSRAIIPLLKAAPRSILLSGTPMLSRPADIFAQLNAVDGEAWPSLKEFSARYCKQSSTYKKASNLHELCTLLTTTVMIRRLKKEILKDLPAKQRRVVETPVIDAAQSEKLATMLEQFRERSSSLAQMARPRRSKAKKAKVAEEVLAAQKAAAAAAAAAGVSLGEVDDQGRTRAELASEKKSLLMGLFRDTGVAKVPAIARYVESLLANEGSGKFLIFGHHRNVLDALASGPLRRVPHIRIDGSTPPRERQQRIRLFQDPAREDIRVALLGITAAGIGITLTAATRVIFAELFWTPSSLLQAEDRAHRIGQTKTVTVQYMLAPNTIDDILWPLIEAKMKQIGEGLGSKTEVMKLHVKDDEALDSKGGVVAGDGFLVEGEDGSDDEGGSGGGGGAVPSEARDEVLVEEIGKEAIATAKAEARDEDDSDDEVLDEDGPSVVFSSHGIEDSDDEAPSGAGAAAAAPEGGRRSSAAASGGAAAAAHSRKRRAAPAPAADASSGSDDDVVLVGASRGGVSVWDAV